MPERPLLIVKFGGTCVDTPAHSAEAAATVQALADEVRPVVIVSAPGRAPSPYATDTLLRLAGAEGLAADETEQDALLACGEIISAALFALRLQGLGLDARSLTGAQAGLATDGRWGRARITGVDPGPLTRLTDTGTVPVVAGFQGAFGDRLATLGRGGSDLTAVALGAALRAPVLILSDVDGVYTADPRIIASARRLPALSYEDTAQLTFRGARMLHPRAAEMALAHEVEVTLARPDAPRSGTRITDAASAERIVREVAEPVLVGGVTSQGGRRQFTLDLDGETTDGGAGRADALFQGLADAGVSLDMIHVSGAAIQFTVEAEVAARTRAVIEVLGIPATEAGDFAKVSIIGGGMHGRPGVMARMVRALHGIGCPIQQSVDSFNVISCLVPGSFEETAVAALHQAFFEAVD